MRLRAGGCCDYCRLPQSAVKFTFPIDHIVARQHGGRTRADNLALACTSCNRHKGPNIAGIDPLTDALVPLFHPRRDSWDEHHAWQGPILIGMTPVGRATILVLAINNKDGINIRRILIDEGIFPP